MALMVIPRWYISIAPSSERTGAPLFALRIFGCSVSAISHAMRSLERGLRFFQRLNPVQFVFHLAEGVRAALSDYRLRFRVEPKQAHVLAFAAIRNQREAAVAVNVCLWPVLPRGALKSCFHIVPVAC